MTVSHQLLVRFCWSVFLGWAFVALWLCAVVLMLQLLHRPYCVVFARFVFVVVQLFSVEFASGIDKMESYGGVAALPWPASFSHSAAWNEWDSPPWWAYHCPTDFGKGHYGGKQCGGACPGKSGAAKGSKGGGKKGKKGIDKGGGGKGKKIAKEPEVAAAAGFDGVAAAPTPGIPPAASKVSARSSRRSAKAQQVVPPLRSIARLTRCAETKDFSELPVSEITGRGLAWLAVGIEAESHENPTLIEFAMKSSVAESSAAAVDKPKSDLVEAGGKSAVEEPKIEAGGKSAVEEPNGETGGKAAVENTPRKRRKREAAGLLRISDFLPQVPGKIETTQAEARAVANAVAGAVAKVDPEDF